MTPKAFVSLAAITLVVVVGAVFAVLRQPGTTTLQLVDEPAFPTLRGNPDAVAKIIVTTPDGSITLVRETGDRWAALERYGYPVDRRRVRELVVALADMRLIERKTAQPVYDRLQVEDPGAENAKSHLVRLESEGGTVLAEAIIGVSATASPAPSRPVPICGVLARRRAGSRAAAWRSARTWQRGWTTRSSISTAAPSSGSGSSPWVSRLRGRARRPGGELRMADLAAGEAIKEDADFARLTGALADVRLEDVKPRDQLSWPHASNLAQIETFDGLEMTVRLAKIDDQYWATFDARAIAPSQDTANPANEAASGPETEGRPAQEATATGASDRNPGGGRRPG